MVIENKIAKTEMVYELKEEYKVPSFEEFVKNYENDDKIIDSYQVENEAKITHGPQYGPGRSDFSGLCRRIKNDLGNPITARISCDSDYYRSNDHNYVGAIIYAIDGKFSWTNSAGEASGRRGRSFSVIVKCTDDWTSADFKSRGSGMVHSRLIEKTFGIDMNNSSEAYRICVSGFSWRNRELRFNSYSLNACNQIGCSSDGSSELSYYEKELARFCWEKYKQEGPGCVFEIPSYCLP